jgi:hypothetical protein
MKPSENITFRLPAAFHNTLVDWATTEKTSHNLLAKRIVIEAIRRNALTEELASMQQQLSDLRKDLAVATRALLVMAGKVKDEEASAWVKRNLPGRH